MRNSNMSENLHGKHKIWVNPIHFPVVFHQKLVHLKKSSSTNMNKAKKNTCAMWTDFFFCMRRNVFFFLILMYNFQHIFNSEQSVQTNALRFYIFLTFDCVSSNILFRNFLLFIVHIAKKRFFLFRELFSPSCTSTYASHY